MNNAKKLLLNTLILTLTSFVIRTIDVSFNVYLTNKIGAAGIGLFSLTMTVYSLAVTFSVSGIRLASTRLVVEAVGKSKNNTRDIMRHCLFFGFAAGTIIAVVLLICADWVSTNWIHSSSSAQPLRILAFSLPFMAMSSAFNGYFTAMRMITKYAVIQLLEQVIKIACIISAIKYFLPNSAEYTCIAVVAGIAISEASSFICLFILYKRGKNIITSPKYSENKIIQPFFRIAAPEAIGAWVRSILLTVEHLLIPIGFKKSGSSSEVSFKNYGTIHGMALPILLYPSAILISLSSLLVPELARCNAAHKQEQINNITARVIHITLLFSFGTAGVLYAFSDGISAAIYHNHEVSTYIRLLAPLIPVMYLDMTVDGILKGLDQQLYSMRYNIIDSALCVILVYFLIPRYSVEGYIFILFASEILNFFLSFRRLIIVSTVEIKMSDYIIRPIVCIVCSVSICKMLSVILIKGYFNDTIELILSIFATMVLYIIVLYLIGSITRDDIKWFKSIIVK